MSARVYAILFFRACPASMAMALRGSSLISFPRPPPAAPRARRAIQTRAVLYGSSGDTPGVLRWKTHPLASRMRISSVDGGVAAPDVGDTEPLPELVTAILRRPPEAGPPATARCGGVTNPTAEHRDAVGRSENQLGVCVIAWTYQQTPAAPCSGRSCCSNLFTLSYSGQYTEAGQARKNRIA